MVAGAKGVTTGDDMPENGLRVRTRRFSVRFTYLNTMDVDFDNEGRNKEMGMSKRNLRVDAGYIHHH